MSPRRRTQAATAGQTAVTELEPSEQAATPPTSIEPPQDAPAWLVEAIQTIAEQESVIKAWDARCKLSPSIAAAIIQNILDGLHYEHASEAAGISYTTFWRWMQKGEDEDELSAFGALRKAVKTAEALALRETIRDVRVAAKTPRNWAAGMTWAERRFPEHWRRRDESTMQVNVGVAIGMAGAPLAPPQILSPTPNNAIALSPANETTVTADRGEAKAPPIAGVSPVNVA